MAAGLADGRLSEQAVIRHDAGPFLLLVVGKGNAEMMGQVAGRVLVKIGGIVAKSRTGAYRSGYFERIPSDTKR